MTELKTLFHRADPETSKEAATKMVGSGKLQRQEFQVYMCILHTTQFRSNFTAKDLWGGNIKSDYHTIQRRLSGLRRKGYIERTGEKRKGCAVWRLK